MQNGATWENLWCQNLHAVLFFLCSIVVTLLHLIICPLSLHACTFVTCSLNVISKQFEADGGSLISVSAFYAIIIMTFACYCRCQMNSVLFIHTVELFYSFICSWRLYLARCYARGWLKSCSQTITVNATRLFLYAVRNVYFQYAVCTYGKYVTAATVLYAKALRPMFSFQYIYYSLWKNVIVMFSCAIPLYCA